MEIQQCELHGVQQPSKSVWQLLILFFRAAGSKFQRWAQLAEQRRQLQDMDERLLKDIGLSRADVERIAGQRWFWDDPAATKEGVDQRYRSSDRH